MVILVTALYLPSLRNDFIYDDIILIVDEPPPRSAADLLAVFGERHWYNLPYYRPVPRLTMVLQKLIHGNRPAPYHLFNVVAMGVTALMAYGLLRLPAFSIRPVPGLVGASLFAVHPIASCVVYPICSGRETLMPGLITLAAVYAFLLPGRRWYLMAVTLFGLSLLCKEQAVMIPGLFVLADGLRLSADAPALRAAKWVRRYLPIALVLAGYLLVRGLVFAATASYQVAVFHHPSGPFLSILYTLQTMFAPFVELVYEPKLPTWWSWWRELIALVAFGALIAAACRKRSQVKPAVFFWLGWFLLALLPTANLLAQEARFAERYGFLALMGPIGIVATLASAAWNRPATRRWSLGAGVAVLVVCAAISFQRCAYFRNNIAFASQWLLTDSGSAQAQSFLGSVLYRQRELDQAIEHFRIALQAKPDDADAHYDLGCALSDRGELDEAVRHLRQALRLKPSFAEAHNRLGNVLGLQGDTAGAIGHYQQALQIRPDLAEAHNNLGTVLFAQNHVDEAIGHYRRAIAINPGFAGAFSNLGNVLLAQGHLDEAIRHYRRAVQLDPGDAQAHYNLGIALEAKGMIDEAIAHYQQAVAIEPNYAKAHYSLGVALRSRGRLGEAISHLQQALRVNPDYAKAHHDLGTALSLNGQPAEAARHFREAARLKPDWPAPLNEAAWILATCPEQDVRDARQAIELAERACELTRYQNAAILDTLAAAYAAAGRFDRAQAMARKAIALAESSQATGIVAGMQQRLALYSQAKPYAAPPRVKAE
jgi:tetratricopeptide (TPR) repeat protein